MNKKLVNRIDNDIIKLGGNPMTESVNEATSKNIVKDLDKVKNDLLKQVAVLIAKKKKLYSNMDIESPMSSAEKKLNKDIADLWSEINKLIVQKRNIKESVKESKLNRVTENKLRKMVRDIIHEEMKESNSESVNEAMKLTDMIPLKEAYHIITHDKKDIWISDNAYKKLKKGKNAMVLGYTEDKHEGGYRELWVSNADIDVIVKSKKGKGLAKVADTYAKYYESKHNNDEGLQRNGW